MSKTVTLLDVARAVGVTKMTASRAYAKPELVSPDTRRKILQTGEELGYVPNLVAGVLSSKRSKIIGVVLSSNDDSMFSETIRGVTSVCEENGYDVLVGLAQMSPAREETILRTFLGRAVDGIVIAKTGFSSETQALLQSGDTPVVEVWDAPRRPIDMACGFANKAAGRLVARYFGEKGYKSVYTCVTDFYRERQRAQGFLDEAKKLGLEAELDQVDQVATGAEQVGFEIGVQAVERILERRKRPRALFMPGDTRACGAMHAALKNGLSVPKEMAICGFGDLTFGRYINPSLTTVNVSAFDIGVHAAAKIIDRLNGAEEKAATLKVKPTIMERDSG